VAFPNSKGDGNLLASPSGLDSKEAEADLSWSHIVGSKKFPLDWGAVSSLFSAFGPGEKEDFGIEVTLPPSLPSLLTSHSVTITRTLQ
jgi:hypothetical protein